MGKVIAIDGPSGAGKSTVAKLIAKELGFDYLDTGALYRTVALALREKSIEPDDQDEKIIEALKDITVTFKGGRVFLKDASCLPGLAPRSEAGTPHDSRSNGRDVSEDIRSTEIDHYSSAFSARKIVRDFLLDAQRNTAFKNDLVIEGRDTATVVFPDAWKKIYLDASLDERAKRRYLQFREKGIDISMDESRKNVIDRDVRDTNRDIAPLKRASNAFLIDSSNLSIEQVMGKILEFIKAKP
ncbi:MAG: d(CMP) kinase [Nitrospirota bacterium]